MIKNTKFLSPKRVWPYTAGKPYVNDGPTLKEYDKWYPEQATIRDLLFIALIAWLIVWWIQ